MSKIQILDRIPDLIFYYFNLYEFTNMSCQDSLDKPNM